MCNGIFEHALATLLLGWVLITKCTSGPISLSAHGCVYVCARAHTCVCVCVSKVVARVHKRTASSAPLLLAYAISTKS